MNILITGRSGNIGTYLCDYLSKAFNFLGLDKEDMDITDKNETVQVITSLKPDAIIHTAALTNIDYCEKNESTAYEINTSGTTNVAYACSILDIPILYLSSNYVYGNFKESPYYETDECCPINVYGKTKLAGEKMIRTLTKKYFILRTSWVFGGSKCYVKKIISNKDTPLFFASGEVVNATYIEDLAACISRMISTSHYGIYNCVNPEPMSKSDMVRKIFHHIEIDKEVLELPHNYLKETAPRPGYSVLNGYLIKSCFNMELPDSSYRLSQYLKKYYPSNNEY